MCAASMPECSKSYKEGTNPKTATTATRTLAPAPAIAAKTESKSSSTNDSFKEIDKHYVEKSTKPFYIYQLFGQYLYKVVKIRKSPAGFTYYTVELHNRTSMETITDKNNVKYAILKFDSRVDSVEEHEKSSILSTNYGAKVIKLSSFNFNQPLKIRRDMRSYWK